MSRDVSFNRFNVLSRRSPSSDAVMEEEEERLEPNKYLDTMREWQMQKYKLYKQGTRLPKFTEIEPEDNRSREHRWWEFQKNLHDRNLTNDDYKWLESNLNKHGLHVRLRLDPLPDNENAFTKDPEYWDEQGEQHTAPLLQIHIEKGSKFVELAGREFSKEEAPFDYHISLCFTNELHRFDLLHSDNGVKLGKEAYNRLRESYNGKEAILNGHVHNFNFDIEPGSVIQGNLPDFYDNKDFIMLHNAGSYANRADHVSM